MKNTMRTVKMAGHSEYYLTTAGIFVLLKVGFKFAACKDLTFLLKPVDKLVGLLTGSHSVFIEDAGFFHEKLNIVIGKYCSGFNFWVLCFLVFAYLALKYFNKRLQKILNIPIALIFAYLLTIFVNTSRIIASVVVQNHVKKYLPIPHSIIHEAIGIITELSFLVLAYYLAEYFLKQRGYNAKPA
jgi:exosortase K